MLSTTGARSPNTERRLSRNRLAVLTSARHIRGSLPCSLSRSERLQLLTVEPVRRVRRQSPRSGHHDTQTGKILSKETGCRFAHAGRCGRQNPAHAKRAQVFSFPSSWVAPYNAAGAINPHQADAAMFRTRILLTLAAA